MASPTVAIATPVTRVTARAPAISTSVGRRAHELAGPSQGGGHGQDFHREQRKAGASKHSEYHAPDDKRRGAGDDRNERKDVCEWEPQSGKIANKAAAARLPARELGRLDSLRGRQHRVMPEGRPKYPS